MPSNVSLMSAVADVFIETRKSKAGNNYQVLVIKFDNDYEIVNFINNDQKYILSQLSND